MRLLVTGGCGFIGSNFVRMVLQKTRHEVVNLDALTYAGNLENLKDLEAEGRYSFVHGRIEDAKLVAEVMRGADAVVHFAAESHVDRSIIDAHPFIKTNVEGTQILLDASRLQSVGRFIHVSTDEVYGSLGATGLFTEGTPLAPNSPYSASKAAADLLARAAYETYGLPVVITRCSNNYGPYQFPEKLIPLMVTNALEGKPLPVYGDGLNVRDWIHVEDHCEAILKVLEAGRTGETYNIGGECEKTNLEVVRAILRALDKPESLIRFVEDRPGHDRRYAMDISKVRAQTGWCPRIPFDKGLERTVEWYVQNRDWWMRIKSGEYRKYYESQYGKRREVRKHKA